MPVSIGAIGLGVPVAGAWREPGVGVSSSSLLQSSSKDVTVTSEIVWKVVASLGADALVPRDLAGRFFNFSVNTGLYRQFSLPLKYAYIPLSLQPNTSYDDRIRKLARTEGYGFKELKLPYTLEVPNLGACRFLVGFRIFPPNIVSLTVRLKLLDKGLKDVSLDSLFKYRSPRSIAHVRDVVTWSLGLIGTYRLSSHRAAHSSNIYASIFWTTFCRRWTTAYRRTFQIFGQTENGKW